MRSVKMAGDLVDKEYKVNEIERLKNLPGPAVDVAYLQGTTKRYIFILKNIQTRNIKDMVASANPRSWEDMATISDTIERILGFYLNTKTSYRVTQKSPNTTPLLSQNAKKTRINTIVVVLP